MKSSSKYRCSRGVSIHSTALFAVLTVFAIVGDVSAQWATSGNNINNTNSGNVGIGTSSPAVKLDVAPGAGDGLRVRSTGADTNTSDVVISNRGISVTTGGFTSPNTYTAVFGNASGQSGQDSGGVLMTVAHTLDNNPNSLLTLYNRNQSGFTQNGFFLKATGSSASDKFWLNTAGSAFFAGNVGVGTSSPNQTLTVSGFNSSGFGNAAQIIGTAPSGTLQNQLNVTSSANSWGLILGHNNSGAASTGYHCANCAHVVNVNNAALVFGTNNADRMRIDASGKVGIGTASPLYSLDVNGGVNGFRSKTTTNSALDAIATFENSDGIQALIRGNGNVGLGTTAPSAKLHVVGDILVTGNIAAKYQDVAEWVPTSQKLAPGTVVVLDAERGSDVVASFQPYDTKVAGVISAKPGLALGESGEDKVLVATTGRVPVKVDATRAPIKVGDLLVTSDTTGYAMKSEPIVINGRSIHSPGTLIGKALEPLEKGTGEIMVLLSLQ